MCSNEVDVKEADLPSGQTASNGKRAALVAVTLGLGCAPITDHDGCGV